MKRAYESMLSTEVRLFPGKRGFIKSGNRFKR